VPQNNINSINNTKQFSVNINVEICKLIVARNRIEAEVMIGRTEQNRLKLTPERECGCIEVIGPNE